jgi:ribosome biogenesis GTPase
MTAEPLLVEGTVFRVNSGNYHVQTAQDGVVICKLRGNLKKELVYSTSGSRPSRVESAHKRRSTDPIAVGDRVQIDPALAMIEAILPRHSELARDSPSQRGQHVLVANLDQVLVVLAARDPKPDLWLLDRFLVMAEAAEIGAGVVVNKMDRVAGEEEAVRAELAVYEEIGYPLYFISARQGWGMDVLKETLRGKISAFAGASGVGKSSLLNAIQPGLTLKTGEVGSLSHNGRHTTTSAELVPLTGGLEAWLADTPGLRQVEFWEVDKDDIPYCFPEFAPFLGECRFHNCRHHGELGCAVQVAVDDGRIDPRRYASYIQMTS